MFTSLDDATSFATDNKKEAQKQNAVRLSEMIALGPDKLMVIERISKTTKFYSVNLADAKPLDATYDDVATSPSLEQLSAAEIEAKGIKPLVKTLVAEFRRCGEHAKEDRSRGRHVAN